MIDKRPGFTTRCVDVANILVSHRRRGHHEPEDPAGACEAAAAGGS
jgi:hypothetical protein